MGQLDDLPENLNATDPREAEKALSAVTEGLKNLQQDLIVQLTQLQTEKSRLLSDIHHLRAEQQQLQSQRLNLLSKRQAAQQQLWAKQLAQAVAAYLQEILVQRLNQIATTRTPANSAASTSLPTPVDGDYSGNAYRLLASLDSTISTTFKSLQKDLSSYHSTLSQQLSNMHSMEQQGEAILEALVNRLNEELKIETAKPPNAKQINPDPFSTPPPLTEPADRPVTDRPTSRPRPTATATVPRPRPSGKPATQAPRPAPAPAANQTKPTSVALRGFILVLVSSLALSIYNVILKIILKEHTVLGMFNMGGLIAPSLGNSILILWIRMLVVVPCMALLATFLYPKVWRDVSKFSTLQDRVLLWSVLQSGLWLFVSQILIYIALGQIPAGIAITIFFIYPIATLLLAWVRFGDRPTPFRVGVMAVIVTGAILVMLSGGTAGPQNSVIWGSLAAAGSGIAFALYVIQMQASAQRMNPVAVSLIQFAIIFVFSSISLLPVNITVDPLNRGALTIGGIILALVTLVAYLCNNIGIRMVGASLASIIGATGPAITAILAWIIIGEDLLKVMEIGWISLPVKLMGVVLVTAGVLALSLERLRNQAKAKG